jgi:DNA-binding SARP family transcriptional activator
VSHEQGDHGGAETSLKYAYQISDAIDSPLVKNEYLIAKAFFALDRGETAAALSILRQAFVLGREMGYCGSYFTWKPSALSRLALLALENNIEVDYARDLIKRRNLVPETRVPFPEIWPWPLRVYTLGRFSLVRDEKSLRFPSKARTKPLDLLKVVIAFGGRDVSEEKICEALWPDARGDIARMSLKSTLHRLRQLMGNEKAIQIHGGRMGLDQRFCWVDVWTFERMIGEMTESSELGLRSAERRSKRKKETVSAGSDSHSEKQALLEKAIALYRGHFLVGDSDKAWTISLRERLRSKFLRAVSALGTSWEETGQFSRAAECFQKGLEVDDLAEELYQRLMTCHLKLSQKAEAVRVYQRCCTTLSGTLGIEPSPETKNIYKSITN